MRADERGRGGAREEANRGGRDERGINSLSGPSLIAYNYDYEVPEARGVGRTARKKKIKGG